MTIRAIYENGVFKPVGDVDLPDKASVEFEPRVVVEQLSAAMAKVYEILSRRYDTGERDLAERHDEHQP